MTILKENIYNLTDRDKLEELLIKNLPNRINGSNEKTTANRFNHPTKVALNKCDFIHFNSKERVSFIIFDIDAIGNSTAREVYPTISKFWEYLYNKLGLEATYITQTNKGYHFGFHLSYHVNLERTKAVDYLNAIREAINTICGCDLHANRHYGIWRNPLRHEFYYSGCINYFLADFKDILKERKKYPKFSKRDIQKKFHYDVSLRQQNKVA